MRPQTMTKVKLPKPKPKAAPSDPQAVKAEHRYRSTEPVQICEWVDDACGYAEVVATRCKGIDESRDTATFANVGAGGA